MGFVNGYIKGGQDQEREQCAEINPPITTVASGFCSSAPVPVASAIGTKPSEATSAVMATGRNRVIAPSWIAWSGKRPDAISCLI